MNPRITQNTICDFGLWTWVFDLKQKDQSPGFNLRNLPTVNPE